MTATKRKPTPVDEMIASTADHRRDALEAAYAICAAKCESIDYTKDHFHIRGLFELTELAVFDLLGWDKKKILRECGRLRSVAHLQAIAGTSADRQAALVRKEETAAALENKGTELAAEIARLQAEHNAMLADHAAAAQKVEQQMQAVERLRTKVSEETKERNSRARMELKTEFRNRRVSPGKLQAIRNMLDIDINSDEGKTLLQAMAKLDGSLLSPGIVTSNGAINTDTWNTYKANLRDELATLEEQHAIGEREYSAALAELEAELDVYAR